MSVQAVLANEYSLSDIVFQTSDKTHINKEKDYEQEENF